MCMKIYAYIHISIHTYIYSYICVYVCVYENACVPFNIHVHASVNHMKVRLYFVAFTSSLNHQLLPVSHGHTSFFLPFTFSLHILLSLLASFPLIPFFLSFSFPHSVTFIHILVPLERSERGNKEKRENIYDNNNLK